MCFIVLQYFVLRSLQRCYVQQDEPLENNKKQIFTFIKLRWRILNKTSPEDSVKIICKDNGMKKKQDYAGLLFYFHTQIMV